MGLFRHDVGAKVPVEIEKLGLYLQSRFDLDIRTLSFISDSQALYSLSIIRSELIADPLQVLADGLFKFISFGKLLGKL